MATKATGVSCYDKAAPDEPIFVLRAKDELAPTLVREWANQARAAGVNDEKVNEALACADAMEQWGMKNGAKVPD